ncbi:MAG TPA: serine hydrolase, partial [Bacteroidetes bacterium]|nr:serine hydrolase [Bacteroidota bacterium]
MLQSTYPASGPGAAILIAHNGQPVFRNAYGMANLELNVPNQPEYVFAIGSMSKQFVAISLLMLEAEGKLNLDDPVTRYLSDYDTLGNNITIRQLLTHTSGIKSFTEMDTFQKLVNVDLGAEEMLELFMHEPLMFEPGSDWSYSNSGYTVAGMIVEKVSGMSLQA